VARAGGGGPAAVTQKTLHDTILEGVKGDHRQPSAGAKHALGGAQALLQLLELGIKVDSDGLEGAGRRVGLHAGMVAERLADDGGEFAGAGQRSRGDDRPRHRPGARLVAIVADHPRDLGLVGFVEEVGGGLSRLAHPHVERPVLGEGEAAIGLVELHRRHADIQRHAVDRRQLAIRQRLVHPREALLDQGQPGVWDECRPVHDRTWIAIEADHSSRPRPEHGARVAASPERAVDMRFARIDGERSDDFIDQYRHVGLSGGGDSAHALIPRSSRR